MTVPSKRNDRIDVQEIASLLDEHSTPLALYASQWTASPDDCVQEAFVELAAQAVRPENPIGWLYKVVRNRALNASRSEQRRKNREQVAAKQNEMKDRVSRIDRTDEQQNLLCTLESLPGDQRELIALRIWSGLTWEEIAKLIGTSSSTAQRKYVSALELLKTKLEMKCLTKPE